MESKHKKLNQFLATSICGNDILSSALYVSAIAIIHAGVYAPVVLLLIGAVLFLYKSVYTEVVEALPVNGGAYNCLLNGTSKTIAAVAGIITLLSYVATCVISAEVAIQYLNTIIHIPIIISTIILLFAFALLVVSGLKDSAYVAAGIFSIHVVSLLLFLVLALVYFLHGHSDFSMNFVQTASIIKEKGSLTYALYLAFSASLLGVSGFESSANFVEEQDHGVFRKTLRNMLLAVTFFNPLIALAALNTLPYVDIVANKDFLLSYAAKIIAGTWFQYLIVIDAFLVLSGAVLTSYVGVSGLVSRMAGDACLPNSLTKQNKKGSYYRIIFSFFLLCTSILVLTHGDLLSLAGVYTIAFLSVMSLFAFGNIVLKESRKELKRTYSAPLLFVVIAFVATLLGIFGNIRIDVQNLKFFEIYFIPSLLIVLVVVYQDQVVKFLIRTTKKNKFINNYLLRKFDDLADGEFIVFIRDTSRIFAALEYIERNETGRKITFVHCDKDENNEKFNDIKQAIYYMQKAGAFADLNIEVIKRDEPFSPKLLEEVSAELNVHKNRVLIGSIHSSHKFDYEELGGVRIIF